MRDRWSWLGQRKPSSKPRRRLNLEFLEDRLTPSWGSLPPAAVVPPTIFTAVTPDGDGNATGNADISANEVDWYKFTAAASGSYVFQATTPSSNLDTVTGLYSSTGGRLAFNDDTSSSNSDSKFSASLVAGRVYYYGVTNYNNTPGGSYTWTLDGPPPAPLPPPAEDSYEDNDTFTAAFDIGTVTAARTMSNLAMVDGHDWFRLNTYTTGTAAHTLSLSFQNAQGNLDLELYNSAGVLVRSSATLGDTETVSFDGLAAGTYYVHAVGVAGAINPSYAMTIAPPGAAPGSPVGNYDITLVTTGLNPSQRQIFEQAALKWESVITAALPAADYYGMLTNGVIINAGSVAIDGPGGILGQAGPDRYRSVSSLPYHGAMQFDTADMANLEANGGLYHTVLHEMGHVLGIGTIWSFKGLLNGGGTSNPLFTGAQATLEYNRIFGVAASGVPLETTGGPGTRDSHWRETLFANEIMTGYLNSGSNPLSRVTVASLADLGYTVNLMKADRFSRPAGGTSGGGSGGGGTTLRAGTDLAADLARRSASNTLRPAPRGTPVQTLARQIATTRTTDVVRHVSPVINQAAQSAAQSADDLFTQLNSRLTKPLTA